MKKLGMIVIAFLIAVSLAACRGGEPNETTAPTTKPTTAPTTQPATTMPTILPNPTLGTNIPDPETNTDMPDMGTEGTGGMAERMLPGRNRR